MPELINCPACNAQVSDHAKACPQCGGPVRGHITNTKAFVFIGLVIVLIIVSVMMA